MKHNGFETLFQYTYKNGNETKNFYSGKVNDVPFCGAGTSPKDIYLEARYPHLCSFGRILPDKVDYKSYSRLAKFGYRFADSHFINTFYEDLKQEYFTEEQSNSTATPNRKQSRDSIPYKRYGFYYEYTPADGSILSYLKAGISKQRVTQKSDFVRYHKHAIPNEMFLNSYFDLHEIYEFKQDKTQFDISSVSKEFDIANTSHIFSFGAGVHHGKFKNQNTKYTQEFNTKFNVTTYDYDIDLSNPLKPLKVEDATFAQPVKTKLLYLYLSDDFSVNDRLNFNYGIRFDRYVYNPETISMPFVQSKNYKLEELGSTKFQALTYQAGVDYEFLDDTYLSYAFSTGFRAPKIEEMYFDTPKDATRYVRNLDLKPEKAQNHEISLIKEYESYAVAGSLFYTKYKDFIDATYEVILDSYMATDWLTGEKYTKYSKDALAYKHTNVNRAKVKGIEINSRFNGDLIDLPREYYATFKATYQKGKRDDGLSMMAIQPFTAIVGLGYSGEKLDVLLTSKYVAKKKSKDAIVKIPPNLSMIDIDEKTGAITKEPQPQENPFLSKSYVVFDLTAGYKISKNFSINVGVFNLFNKKYSTWENIRQIGYNGNQGFSLESGKGLDRYTAPGRNFAISFEARY